MDQINEYMNRFLSAGGIFYFHTQEGAMLPHCPTPYSHSTITENHQHRAKDWAERIWLMRLIFNAFTKFSESLFNSWSLQSMNVHV